jgi:hypothetical protein
MIKRWLARAASLVVLSGSMLAAPAHAWDLTQVHTTEFLVAPAVTVTELDVTYTTQAEPFTDLTSVFVIPTTTTGLLSSSGATVMETFSPNPDATTGVVTSFTFTVPLDLATAVSEIKITGAHWVTNTGGDISTAPTLSFTSVLTAVPEPSSALAVAFAALAGLGVWARRRRRQG